MTKKRPPESDDAASSFANIAESLGDVTRLEGKRRIERTTKPTPREAAEPRRGGPEFRFPDPLEPLLGYRSGCQRERLNRLARGEPAAESNIDLHGLGRDSAARSLTNAIETASRTGVRCLRVVHGRGAKSPDGVAVLRDALPGWLTRGRAATHVLAFAPALQRDGGDGATYVLLRC